MTIKLNSTCIHNSYKLIKTCGRNNLKDKYKEEKILWVQNLSNAIKADIFIKKRGKGTEEIIQLLV